MNACIFAYFPVGIQAIPLAVLSNGIKDLLL